MNMRRILYHIGVGVLLLSLSGCAGSYYETVSGIHKAVQSGDYQRADELLSNEEKLAQGRNRLLYLLDKAMIAHLNEQYAESNQFFEQADALMEQLSVASITGTASEWLINETTQTYKGEDFERVMVHYYMALNYLMIHDLENALVECRRFNTLLQEFNNRYENKNVYKTDAFALYLSGLIYEAMGDTNDARIDYEQAYMTYRSDYQEHYGTSAPAQLVDNLLRTLSTLGFSDKVTQYGQEVGKDVWTTQEEYRDSARLVVIWDNGLIPYKRQWTYRQYLETDDHHDNGCYVKFAFPQFVQRAPLYTHAAVTAGGKTTELELGEDLARIAIKNLEDRRMRVLARGIARNALKCLAEQEIKDENRILGWLFALFTEVTEQADTRSWLLLPADISMTQMLIPPGVADVELSFFDVVGQVGQQRYENITFEQGRTTFLIHRTF